MWTNHTSDLALAIMSTTPQAVDSGFLRMFVRRRYRSEVKRKMNYQSRGSNTKPPTSTKTHHNVRHSYGRQMLHHQDNESNELTQRRRIGAKNRRQWMICEDLRDDRAQTGPFVSQHSKRHCVD